MLMSNWHLKTATKIAEKNEKLSPFYKKKEQKYLFVEVVRASSLQLYLRNDIKNLSESLAFRTFFVSLQHQY